MEAGDKVIFMGCTDEQRAWGSNDDPRKILTVGLEYIIDYVEVHSWHTKICLEGIEGVFNSVSFEKSR